MRCDFAIRSRGWIVRCDSVVRSRAREVRLCGTTFVEPKGIVERGVVSWVVVSKVRTF